MEPWRGPGPQQLQLREAPERAPEQRHTPEQDERQPQEHRAHVKPQPSGPNRQAAAAATKHEEKPAAAAATAPIWRVRHADALRHAAATATVRRQHADADASAATATTTATATTAATATATATTAAAATSAICRLWHAPAGNAFQPDGNEHGAGAFHVTVRGKYLG